MQLRRAARVIIVGAPGVGKGTQSERLLRRFPQLASISTGDLLRSNVKNRTPLGQSALPPGRKAHQSTPLIDMTAGIKAESTMNAGGLVADDLMLRLISSELRNRGWLQSHGPPEVMTLSSEATAAAAADVQAPDTMTLGAFAAGRPLSPAQVSEDPTASFILDGYPRNAAQASSLEGIVPINLAVSLKTPFEVILERIAGRWVHEPSGRVYNTTFNAPDVPGRDDVTGEPLTQRPDDTEDVYRARFQKFQEASEPLLEHYAKRGILVEVEGMSSDEISPKLYQVFEQRFVM
ncbi:adenylate kinase [Metarhizium album ARSEF 1941]|uniref:GTP:AMP phosphotransferase, mitochondrial n=1 Tax=Metarhizium album (strain ARSEF 1941) TaxID=1081103 RepID=A0A0B2WM20_METAS|nr:adenylate kinase [Metarhizium album ARSEF 1941]KHN94704.1 adenylate kinase [Metarhizium album ARSEF 1941]